MSCLAKEAYIFGARRPGTSKSEMTFDPESYFSASERYYKAKAKEQPTDRRKAMLVGGLTGGALGGATLGSAALVDPGFSAKGALGFTGLGVLGGGLLGAGLVSAAARSDRLNIGRAQDVLKLSLPERQRLYRTQAVTAFEMEEEMREAEARRRHEEMIEALSRPRPRDTYTRYPGFNYDY